MNSNDDGTWRETQFYQVLNTTYIPIALNAARAADPHAKLYINEYNITGPGPPSPPLCARRTHTYQQARKRRQ